MPRLTSQWNTQRVRDWLATRPGTVEWIGSYATVELRVMALRLSASNTSADELLGVNFSLVDWHGIAVELGKPPAMR